MEKEIRIVNVTPHNSDTYTLFCVRDIKSEAYKLKKEWYTREFSKGLRMNILLDEGDLPLGYIEFVPDNSAWRPVENTGYMFIHCMYVYSKSDRNRGFAGMLIDSCIKAAQEADLMGVSVMTSKGTWIADKRVFLKKGFQKVEHLGRFELLAFKFNPDSPNPGMIDWESKASGYQGWHLLYADQCPWHEKSAKALSEAAREAGIAMNISRIATSEEAKHSPSGFGVFCLIHNGKVLSDHYISKTRFLNILRSEGIGSV